MEAEFNGSPTINLKVRSPDQPDGATASPDDGRNLSNDYMQQRRAAFVSYSIFLESYWTHFPQPLTKGLGMFDGHAVHSGILLNLYLDPALVFGEFMGMQR